MTKKWKIILICFLILPCVVFFGGCSCSEDAGPGVNENVVYNVNFYTGSEDTFNIPIQTIKHGGLVFRPIKPTRIGWSFVGWYADMSLQTPWKFESDIVVSNITLYAKWTPILNDDNSYTVTFYSGTTEVDIPDQKVPISGLVTKPADPTKSGYTFEGWYRDKELTIKWNFSKDIVNQNIVLYARWERIIIEH